MQDTNLSFRSRGADNETGRGLIAKTRELMAREQAELQRLFIRVARTDATRAEVGIALFPPRPCVLNVFVESPKIDSQRLLGTPALSLEIRCLSYGKGYGERMGRPDQLPGEKLIGPFSLALASPSQKPAFGTWRSPAIVPARKGTLGATGRQLEVR